MTDRDELVVLHLDDVTDDDVLPSDVLQLPFWRHDVRDAVVDDAVAAMTLLHNRT